MIISHNLAAMNAQRQYGIVNHKRAKSTEKLSSGYRINRAADDALHEVSDILNRMEELAVKAANGTNSGEDRSYIQQEIEDLLEEVNRIADTTTFNEIPLFKGKDVIRVNADGTPAIEGNIPFTDFRMADLTLGQSPISQNSGANSLALQAIVDSAASASNGKTYNLIYGNGGTSSSSIRVKTDSMTSPQVIGLNEMQISNYSKGTDANGKAYWSRNLTYQNGDVDIRIVQTIAINENTNAIKVYVINYKIENQSAENAEVDFMFHADTAYNNNDRCEAYFIGSNRVDKRCIYSDAGSKFTAGSTNPNVHNSGVPDSISIVDVDNALAFSEKSHFRPAISLPVFL